MQEPTSDRWQLILVGAFLAVITIGVYFANRATPLVTTKTPISGLRDPPGGAKKERTTRASSRKNATTKHARTAHLTTDGGVPANAEQPAQLDCRTADDNRRVPGPRLPTIDSLMTAVRLVDSDRVAAIDALQRLKGFPVSDAYLAYLLLLLDRQTESQEALSRARRALPQSLCTLSQLSSDTRTNDNPIQVSLRTIRLAIEENLHEGEAIPLACSVFRTHPYDSSVAFGVMWGTFRDDLGKRMKRDCVEKLLRQVSPRLTLRIMKAESDLCEALKRVEPIPQEPIYQSIYIAACDLLRDAILAPELTQLSTENASTESIKVITRTTPMVSRRIAEYDATLDRWAHDVGMGICAILSSRNQEDSLERCVRRAKQAAHEALASWLASVHGSTTTPKDAPMRSAPPIAPEGPASIPYNTERP